MKKRVVFTTGGKGGTGKTTLAAVLAEWYQENEIPCTLLDLDIENKTKGSLGHFFQKQIRKIDIHEPGGLDAFIDAADQAPGVILADMGAGSGKVAAEWFQTMYGPVSNYLVFTAIGLVTSDPASVESLLTWATYLQDRVEYLVVLNQLEDDRPNFHYWEASAEAQKFREAFQPGVISMENRIPGLQHAVRNHGITLKTIGDRQASQPEFNQTSLVIRAQAYRRHLFESFDQVKGVLLP
jgi:MinD-like ATPase involved in chromosome partitioning or flagellar assembly